MRKIIVPIVDIVILILIGISFGLAGITFLKDASQASIGTFYQLVWPADMKVNAVALVAFFAMCVAPFFTLLSFVPFKLRSAFNGLSAVLLIGAGVIALMLPKILTSGMEVALTLYLQGGAWGMAILLFVAALLSIINVLIDVALLKAER